MKKVTDLRRGKNRGKRLNVFLDGRFAFSLQVEVAVKTGLQIGQELSTNQIEKLTGTDHLHRCLDAATLYLSYRPRSESEVREKLERRGFDDGSITATLNKLKAQKLVDDVAFATFWKENRETFSPRSQRLTGLELKKKGVAAEIISQVVSTADDSVGAYRAALAKARRLPLDDYQAFHRRLVAYLQRRGFSYETIKNTTEQVWQESRNSSVEQEA